MTTREKRRRPAHRAHGVAQVAPQMLEPRHARLVVVGVTEGCGAQLSIRGRAGAARGELFREQLAMQRQLAIEPVPHRPLAEHRENRAAHSRITVPRQVPAAPAS